MQSPLSVADTERHDTLGSIAARFLLVFDLHGPTVECMFRAADGSARLWRPGRLMKLHACLQDGCRWLVALDEAYADAVWAVRTDPDAPEVLVDFVVLQNLGPRRRAKASLERALRVVDRLCASSVARITEGRSGRLLICRVWQSVVRSALQQYLRLLLFLQETAEAFEDSL